MYSHEILSNGNTRSSRVNLYKRRSRILHGRVFKFIQDDALALAVEMRLLANRMISGGDEKGLASVSDINKVSNPMN